MSGFSRGKLEAGRNELGLCTARYESKRLLLVCFEGLARLSLRVWRRFVRGSREISLVPSLHRASTDALIHCVVSAFTKQVSCSYIQLDNLSLNRMAQTLLYIQLYRCTCSPCHWNCLYSTGHMLGGYSSSLVASIEPALMALIYTIALTVYTSYYFVLLIYIDCT